MSVEQIRFNRDSQAISGRNILFSEKRRHVLDDNDRTLVGSAQKSAELEVRARPAMTGPVWSTSATSGPDYQVLGGYYWPATGHFYWVTKALAANLATSAAATLRRSTTVTGAMSSLQVMGNTTEVYAHFEEYRYGSTHVLLVSIGTEMWAIDTSNVVTQVTDSDLPAHHPKFAVMDGYVFVAKANSQDIYNSNVGDYTSWQASTFIRAEQSPSLLQGVAVVQNHIAGVKTNSIEFFRDAGIPSPNSPLQRVTEYFVPVGCSSSIGFHSDGQRLVTWGIESASMITSAGTHVACLWEVTPGKVARVPTSEIIDPGNLGQAFVQKYILPRQREVYVVRFYSTSTWVYVTPAWVIDRESGFTYQWTHPIDSSLSNPDTSEYWLLGTFSNGYIIPLVGTDGSGYRKGVNFLTETTPYEQLFNSGTYASSGIYMRIEVPINAGNSGQRRSLHAVRLLSPSIAYAALGGTVTTGFNATVSQIFYTGNGENLSSVSRTWAIVNYVTSSSTNVNQLTLRSFGMMDQGVLRFVIPTAPVAQGGGTQQFAAWDFSLYGIDLHYTDTTRI